MSGRRYIYLGLLLISRMLSERHIPFWKPLVVGCFVIAADTAPCHIKVLINVGRANLSEQRPDGLRKQRDSGETAYCVQSTE